MFIFLLYISHLSWNTNQPQPKKDHNMSKSIERLQKIVQVHSENTENL